MATSAPPSLRRVSVFSVTWYFSVVAGWGLVVLSTAAIAMSSSWQAAGPALAMTAVLLVLLELRPVVASGRHDPQGVVMSDAFVCAILLLWGLWPAIVLFSVATLTSELRKRKQARKLFFNVGQYNVTVGVAWLVMVATGHTPSLEQPLDPLTGWDLPWVAGVWVVYFGVNKVLVSGVLAWSDSFRGVFLDDFAYNASTTFAVLALSPLVVVVAQNAWALLPLLLVPLLLIYKTAQMSLEKEHQTAHDSLTSLPNRKHLQASLTGALAGSARDGRPCGLLLIDLDHFKEVNDTLGHHVGDQLLMHFADQLRASVRPTDVTARLGGDEFAVIVPDANEAQVRSVAERIRAALAEPMQLEGMLLDVEASIGVAMHPEHGSDADELLRLADVAMYVAKETRTGVVTYSTQRDRNSPDRLSLLGELRRALDEGQLALHYQPKVSPADSTLLGMEALVRWRHPERGFVPPDEFIPLAERSGIMHLLTERVMTLALGQMAQWREQGLHVPVAVNVSVTDLTGSRLTDLLADGLSRHGLPAGMLQLEVTERVVAQETDELDPVLRDLNRMGVTLSLDDFGTGYSSLLRLQSLPVSELKIDRAFVSRLTEGDAAVGIVRAVIDLAHALGMPAIAEGVETEAEWRLLRVLQCDGAQGWYVARPMPAEQATQWLRDRYDLVPAVPAPRTAASVDAR